MQGAMRIHWLWFSLCLSVGVDQSSTFGADPWSTYRGNSQRTGNTDGKAGPSTPRVLWSYASKDHFIAAPVPYQDRLYVSGFGAFNVSTFLSLDLDPRASKRVAWRKSTPYLKLPTVSSPAIREGLLVFGDGMHQTDGAVLHCLRLDKGLPLCELPVPGSLVHLEGAPTISAHQAYLGGGAAGVLCVDLNRISLDGKELSVEAIQKVLDQKWSMLQAKFEADRKKDPTFAVPPTDDDLPKPAPRLVWQQGKEKWHVDAPVAVAGDRVLVASAFLDKEKVGDRALFCLDSKTGKELWRAALPINPWGGPSIQGNLVVVSGSTIGFAPGSLKGAKGFVAAFDLQDGKEKWKKTVTAGVLSCAALTSDLAVTTATDGKVRAFALETGERRWIYDARAPFFAPVTLAGGMVYAGDLHGVVHAIDLKRGIGKWKFDVGADPAVKAPGMIYGGPALHGGRLYVATCNLEGANARKPTTVVCIGDK